MVISLISDPAQGQSPPTSLNELKEKFIQLYMNEDRPLREIMEILSREDGCNASWNMYQKQIRRWKLGKNAQYEDMLSFLRAIYQRKAQGKPPITRSIRGRVFDEDHAAQYFRRKFGYRNLETAILVLLKPQGEAGSNKAMSKSGDTCIAKRVSLPQVYERHTEIFYLIRAWQAQCLTPFAFPEGLFSGKLDENDDQVKSIVKLREPYIHGSAHKTSSVVYDSYLHGICLLRDGHSTAGFASLQRALTHMREYISNKYPHLLLHVMDIVSAAFLNGQLKLGQMLVQQLLEHSRIVFGPSHPLSRLFQLLLPECESMNFLAYGMRATYDATSSTLGQADSWTLAQQNTILNARLDMFDQTYEEIRQRFEKAIHSISTSKNAASSHNFTLLMNCKGYYSIHLVEHGDLEGAERLYSNVPDLLYDDNLTDRQKGNVMYAVCYLTEIMIKRGRIEQAEQLFEKGITRCRLLLTPETPARINMTRKYVKFHHEVTKTVDKESMERIYNSLLEPYNLPDMASSTA